MEFYYPIELPSELGNKKLLSSLLDPEVFPNSANRQPQEEVRYFKQSHLY